MRTCTCGNSADVAYNDYLRQIEIRVQGLAEAGLLLFKTDAKDLYKIYLDSFDDPAERQYHTCHACQDFIEKYGGLVFLSDDGVVIPAAWNQHEAPDYYKIATGALQQAVSKAKVTSVFYSSLKTLGNPKTSVWKHFYLTNPTPYSAKLKTPEQAMAEKQEEYKMLCQALVEYKKEVVEQAVTLLKTDALYRSEKVLGVAEWLLSVHNKIADKRGNIRSNLIWIAVSEAPVGFCHVKSSMIGTLLEDIAAGLEYREIERRFANKMHPLQYQRPQAAPTSGNIARGEEIVKKLGIEKSLERRFARIEEIPLIWKPQEAQEAKRDGVFGHLLTEKAQPINVTSVTDITWVKFLATVLPEATKISMLVQQQSRGPFCAIVTAVHDDAPIIHQWGNSFSWYLYNHGSLPSEFNIYGSEVEVTGICLKPSAWNSTRKNQGDGVLFILNDARDMNYERSGNALFPETLISDLHEIRATIEAYSKNAVLEGFTDASACGILVGGNGRANSSVFRVTFKTGQTANYRIDRWD